MDVVHTLKNAHGGERRFHHHLQKVIEFTALIEVQGQYF